MNQGNFRGSLRRHLALRVALPVLATLLYSAPPASASGCPNEAVRTGASIALPNCRAYELVTPPDSNGRTLAAIGTFGFTAPMDLFPTELMSPLGSSAAYMTYSSPLRAPEGPNGVFDVYVAERSGTGWETQRRITPDGVEAVSPVPGGISSDQRYAFTDVGLLLGGEIPSGTLAGPGIRSYISKPDGSFEFTGKGALASDPYAQGRYISPGGEHVVFSTGHVDGQSFWCVSSPTCMVPKLEENAPPEGTGAIYDRKIGDDTHVVSVLPGNKPLANEEQSFYQGASKTGEVVAFVVGSTLYARVDNAVTVKVVEGESTFAGLSDDGRYLYYLSGGSAQAGNIHRFNTATEADEQINASADGEIVNVSADGSHVYFISPSQLDGGLGTAGGPNLYVWSGGSPRYITTVATSDLERTSGDRVGIPALTRWTSHAVAPIKNILVGPGADSSRSTPDGQVLVFESRAKLAGYENAGHTEIYRYDDLSEEISCVSCNSLQEPATGDARLQELRLVSEGFVLHNLSDDGSRVFFETSEALVPEDTDGVNDVYEWEKTESGSSLNLISSGKSVEYPPLFLPEVSPIPAPNVLLSVTPSGDDVLFLSQDALVNGAPEGGATAIYDARVGGGFPEPVELPGCTEEGCKPSPTPPPQLSGGSVTEETHGAGNVKPKKQACPRHSHKHRKHRHCKRGKSKKKRSQRPAADSSRTGIPEGGQTPEAPEPLSAASEVSSGGSPVSEKSPPSTHSPVAHMSEFEGFGIESVGANESTTAAGAHPDFFNSIAVHQVVVKGEPRTPGRVEDVEVSLPPGLLGNPNAIPRCETGQLVAFANCPIDSQVGLTRVLVEGFPGKLTEPIYNMTPPHPESEIARFGFYAYLYPVFIDVKVRTAGDYGVTATVHSGPGRGALLEAQTTFWGNPTDPSHDPQRLTAVEALECSGTATACKAPGGKRESGIPVGARKAFMTNPSACQGGEVAFSVTSYQLPGQVFSKSASLAPITNCSGLPFAPGLELEPTSHAAGAPTGLETRLVIPQHEGPEETSTATLREAKVSLPAGMQIAAGAADGIAACSAEQIGFHEEGDAACPDGSKIGSATITSPSLPEPIAGALYQRSPSPGHPFGLWLASDALGLHIKIPGEIVPDPQNGRLTAIFKDLPQVPVQEIDLDVWGGPRAPLQNPAECGTYATEYTFTPHSQDPSVLGQSQMQITEGCSQGFSPSLHAGAADPRAGAYSPFSFDLTRRDGEAPLQGFTLTLPQGELAKVAGVPLCSDAQAAATSCPADSEIGRLTAAAGPGPNPLWIPQPGKNRPAIFLAGPYHDAPYSVVTEVPAQAGPFDLGVITVRSALRVDPETAQASVEANPLPQFFEGVGLTYRRLRATIDRPGFSLNPTDCREMAVNSTVAATTGAVAHPAARFQVDGCSSLGFKPKLALSLKGASRRGAFPALTAILKARPGDANISKASVALPHSEFLAQEHIGTICTRVQFAAHACPKASIYGVGKAFTPLLDHPLVGPVYLRSSNHLLPDLVVALRGQLEVDLVGRIDSRHGGIRTSFEAVPDAPVAKFVLRMRGGSKGLLVNSTDICRGHHRAQVRLRAQNGRKRTFSSPLTVNRCRHQR